MNDPKFTATQWVKFITFSGHDPQMDRMLNALVGKEGVVESYYCIGRDEMPDRIKMVLYPDYVYCYEIRLSDGTLLRSIPEVALAAIE